MLQLPLLLDCTRVGFKLRVVNSMPLGRPLPLTVATLRRSTAGKHLP
jgi:hypothetical protein